MPPPDSIKVTTVGWFMVLSVHGCYFLCVVIYCKTYYIVWSIIIKYFCIILSLFKIKQKYSHVNKLFNKLVFKWNVFVNSSEYSLKYHNATEHIYCCSAEQTQTQTMLLIMQSKYIQLLSTLFNRFCHNNVFFKWKWFPNEHKNVT